MIDQFKEDLKVYIERILMPTTEEEFNKLWNYGDVLVNINSTKYEVFNALRYYSNAFNKDIIYISNRTKVLSKDEYASCTRIIIFLKILQSEFN